MSFFEWLNTDSGPRDLFAGVLALLAMGIFVRLTRGPK